MRVVVLDLVRFFAAMSVVLYHYTAREESDSFAYIEEITKFGYLGVCLFFMLSGYVIALSAKNRRPIEFVISRFVRLYPAFWAGIIFTIIVVYVFNGRTFELSQILANATMLNDYLGINNIDGVYWTLQAELKFYFCIFLLMSFGHFEKYSVWLTFWLILTVIYMALGQPFFMSWFISPYYSSFFMAGVLFYLIHNDRADKFRNMLLLSSAVISSYVTFQQVNSFILTPTILEKSMAVLVVLGFYLLFYLIVFEKIQLKKRSAYSILGGVTYPLYLIHSLAGKTIIDDLTLYISEVYAVLITILIMLFFSVLIHVYIEKKIATPLKSRLLRYTSKKIISN